MPLRLLNPPKKAYEVDPTRTQEAELLAKSKFNYGRYLVHPIGDPTIRVKVGDTLYRGTTSNYLSARGIESIGITPDFNEARIYFSESQNDAAGYAYIHKEGGYDTGTSKTRPGGVPIFVKVRVDQELLKQLRPGFEGGGEWYIKADYLPRKHVISIKQLPRNHDAWADDPDNETIDYYASLPEYHGRSYEKEANEKAEAHELESYDALVEGLDDGILQPFRGYDLTINGEKWHYWVEEWSSLCTEEYFDDKRVKKDREGEPVEESLDAEERRALDTAMDLFAKDLVKDAPGRAPDYEDWLETDGIYGYQILGWKERPGEKWGRWVRRSSVSFPGVTPFRQMCRVLPPERVVP